MTTKKRKSGQPITAHRLFPALVAVWFAALFGLGSFAVQPQLLERIVAASHLPTLVPATAPPLGVTARLLVAFAMTLVGLGLGLIAGLRLRPRIEAAPRRRTPAARASTDTAPRARNRDSHPDAPVCTPLILSDDLIADGVGQADSDAEFVPFRRRVQPVIDDLPEVDDQEVEEALPADPVAQDDDVTVAAQMAVAPSLSAIPAPIIPGAPRSPIALAKLDSLGLVQLIERLALAIAERQALLEAASDDASVEEEPVAAPASRWPQAPCVEGQSTRTSHSSLFQRALSGGLSIDASPTEADAAGEATSGEPGHGADFSFAITPSPYSPLVEKPGQRIVSLRPARFDSAAQQPELDPELDEEDEGDDDADFLIPRFLGIATITPTLDEDGLPEPPVPEDRYPSLVDMQPPLPRPDALRQEFIRVEDFEGDFAEGNEPVVVFPGQGPFTRPTQASPAIPQAFTPDPAPAPDPAEADRALRAALATLQRMTAKG